MNIDYYSVWYKDICSLAEHMSLENALLFVEALFHKYYNESTEYTIRKEIPCEENCESRMNRE
jgi:hypothetical protein